MFITVIIIVSVFLIILFFRWLIRLLLSRQRRRDDVTEELKVKRKMKNKKELIANEDVEGLKEKMRLSTKRRMRFDK